MHRLSVETGELENRETAKFEGKLFVGFGQVYRCLMREGYRLFIWGQLPRTGRTMSNDLLNAVADIDEQQIILWALRQVDGPSAVENIGGRLIAFDDLRPFFAGN